MRYKAIICIAAIVLIGLIFLLPKEPATKANLNAVEITAKTLEITLQNEKLADSLKNLTKTVR